jgi:gluconokinase
MSRHAAPTSSVVLALDIGTSSVRAALYDAVGFEIVGTQSRTLRNLCTTSDGGAEAEAEEAVGHVARTIDAVLAQTAFLKPRIEMVAVSCFWHSLVGVSEEGRAVTPIFGWADTRAGLQARELRQHLDEEKFHARTGCRFHPSYWPAKLLWLSRERPRQFRATAKWLSFGEFLALRLLGETEASVSMASGTGLLNQSSCEWDAELLAELKINEHQLPLIAHDKRTFNALTSEYSSRWPQLERAFWFPAIGDGAANNIGAGCISRERAALMVGTSGAMRVMWEGEPTRALPYALWSYRADRRRVVAGGALSDGGGLYDWMHGSLALDGEREATESAIARLEPDAHGLTVLPFWAGERSTGWTSVARGAILGLTMHTRPIEILRAAMEAVAYRFSLIRRSLEPLAPGAHLVASGGALLASTVWTQMMADALGRPLTLSGVAEASSRGAVLLALEATGKIKSIGDAPAPMGRTYEPDMAHHACYQSGLERQQKIYERVIVDTETARVISDAARVQRLEDECRTNGFPITDSEDN